MTLTKTIRLTFLHTPAMTLSGLTPTQFTVMTIISVLRSGVVFSTAGFFQPSQLITVLTITIFRVSIFRLRHMCLLIKLTVQVLKQILTGSWEEMRLILVSTLQGMRYYPGDIFQKEIHLLLFRRLLKKSGHGKELYMSMTNSF